MLGCETRGQSVAVAVASGGFAGAIGSTAGIDLPVVVALAAMLAVCGEVVAHTFRGDDQWRDAIARVRAEGE